MHRLSFATSRPHLVARSFLPAAMVACAALALFHCDNASSNPSVDLGNDSGTTGGDGATTSDGGDPSTSLTADNFRGYVTSRLNFTVGGNQVFVSGEFFLEPRTDEQRAALKTIADFMVPQLIPQAGCVSGPEPQRPADPPGLQRLDVQSLEVSFPPATERFPIAKAGVGDHFGSAAAPPGDGPIEISLFLGISPFLTGEQTLLAPNGIWVRSLTPDAADAGGSVKLTRGQAFPITVNTTAPSGGFIRASLGFASTRVTCTAIGTNTITIPASVIDAIPDSGDVELGVGSTQLVPGQGGMWSFESFSLGHGFNYYF